MAGTKRWSAVLVAAALSAAVSTAASADDFVSLCNGAVPPMPGADKLCVCMSGRLAGPERSAAIGAMRAMRDAQTRGAPLDPAKLSADLSRAIEGVMAGMMQCAPAMMPSPPRSGD